MTQASVTWHTIPGQYGDERVTEVGRYLDAALKAVLLKSAEYRSEKERINAHARLIHVAKSSFGSGPIRRPPGDIRPLMCRFLA
jgi:hypothetical protein